ATTEGMSPGAKACRSSSASIGMRIGWSDIVRGDHGLDAAAYGKITDDGHAARLACGHQIVENLVRDVLVEDAAVAELDDVGLERLQLDTARVGAVADANRPEIGQPRLRAQRCELGTLDGDLVIALRTRVRKRFERRA